MKKQELEALAREVAKGLKTEEDLNEFSQMLTKVTVEEALNAELEDHLGYARDPLLVTCSICRLGISLYDLPPVTDSIRCLAIYPEDQFTYNND